MSIAGSVQRIYELGFQYNAQQVAIAALTGVAAGDLQQLIDAIRPAVARGASAAELAEFDFHAVDLKVLLRRREFIDSKELADVLISRYDKKEEDVGFLRNPKTSKPAISAFLRKLAIEMMAAGVDMDRDGNPRCPTSTGTLAMAVAAEERPATNDDGVTADAAAMNVGTGVRGTAKSFQMFVEAYAAVKGCCSFTGELRVLKVTKSASGAFAEFWSSAAIDADIFKLATGGCPLQKTMLVRWRMAWDAAANGTSVAIAQGGQSAGHVTVVVATILTLYYCSTHGHGNLPLCGVRFFALCRALLDRLTNDVATLRYTDDHLMVRTMREVPEHIANYDPWKPKPAATPPAALQTPHHDAAPAAQATLPYRGRGTGRGGGRGLTTNPGQHHLVTGGRGGSPLACHKCGKLGHFARDCRANAAGVTETRTCNGCGKTGHLARDCPTAEVKKCFRCDKPGHFSRDCPNAT